jgi:alpha-glucosidase
MMQLATAAGEIVGKGAPILLAVEACGKGVMRLRFGGSGAVAAAPSYLPKAAWAGATTVAEASSTEVVAGGGLSLRLLAESGRLELRDFGDEPRLVLDLAAIETRVRLRFGFEILGDQHFYGLGHGGRPLDRLGATRRLWNSHVDHGPGSDIAIPLLLSHLGYGLFFDNPAPALIGAGKSADRVCFDYETEAQAFDLYFFGGANLREAVSLSADLLGHAPMPPRWALGYLQSTRHFDGPDEVRVLATTLRDKGLPCDALILLSTYSDGKGWNRAVGSLDYESSMFPEPRATIAALKARGFRVVTHEYPVVHESSPLYAVAVEQGFLLDDGYQRVTPGRRPSTNYHEGQRFIDFEEPAAGRWWWDAHRGLNADGVDGWWLDGGEGPTASDVLERPGGPALHNRFDLFRQQAFANGEARDNPDRRPFLLCRSGGAGMQRFGAACWSGDINNTWTTLEAQASLGLNTGLSGVPLWGTDIGGFYPVAPQSGELFARWFQFGSFNPVFRCHGQRWRMHVPWAYGPEIEAICRRYLDLRYRLMPYTYTLVREAHETGMPLMRMLALVYPDDPEALDRSSEFLWGDDILVAPVTREGARHWPVYLPRGAWYDFWTGVRYEGPAAVSVEAPIDRLPLFVRCGAILPLGPMVQHLSSYAPDEITLLTYPEGSTRSSLYDDDGETNAYRGGGFAWTTFSVEQLSRGLDLRIAVARGDADVIAPGRTYSFRILTSETPRSVRKADGGSVAWRRDGSFLIVPCGRGPTDIKLDW